MPVTLKQLEEQLIQELFNAPYDWHWVEDDRLAVFETEENHYSVEFAGTGYVELLFGISHPEFPGDIDYYEVTNEGVSSKVIATVIDIVMDFIQTQGNINELVFAASKSGINRARTYQKIIQRVLPDDYELTTRSDGGKYVEFVIKHRKD